MEELFTNEKLDSNKFLRLLYVNRRLLIIAAICTFGTSIAVTTTIAPKYYSVGIIFPTNSNSARQTLENPQFGYDLDADRLMQILESEIVMDSIIEMYDLINYYEIDTSKLDWEFYLDKNFVEDVTFFRSRYMSIVINAQTKDPVLSAKIVNSIIDMIDGLRADIFRTNTMLAVTAIEGDFRLKETEVDILIDSVYAYRRLNSNASTAHLDVQYQGKRKVIDSYRKDLAALQQEYNFYNLPLQLQTANDKLTDAQSTLAQAESRLVVLKQNYSASDSVIINGEVRLQGTKAEIQYWEKTQQGLQAASKSYNTLRTNLDAETAVFNELKQSYESALNAFEPEVNSFRLQHMIDQLRDERDQLNHLKIKYEEAKAMHEAPFPKVYVIDRAKPDYKKASPSYSFNAIVGTLAVLLFCIVFLLFRSRLRDLRAEVSQE